MLRRILTYNLAVLLLTTNIGIPVFTHICHTQAKSWSSIYVPAKSCCSKKKDGMTAVCHLDLDQKAQISRRPCCENHQDLIQLNADFLQTLSKPGVDSNSFHFIANNDAILHSFLCNGYDLLKTVRAHGPPVNLYGRSLLISEQVFLC